MKGFGVHTSMWTMNWDRQGAETAIAAASEYSMDFIEIPMLNPPAIDAAHTRTLLQKHQLRAMCSLGLPDTAYASNNPDAAIAHLRMALDKTHEIGSEGLSGVTFGGIGERSGLPPTTAELDNVARVLSAAAKHARRTGQANKEESWQAFHPHMPVTP